MSVKLKNVLEDGIRKVRDYDACLASEDVIARYTEIRDKAKKALARMEDTVMTIADCVVRNVDLFKRDFDGAKTVYVESPAGCFSVNRERHSISMRVLSLTALHVNLDDLTVERMQAAAMQLDGYGLLPNNPNLNNADFWISVRKDTEELTAWTNKLEEIMSVAIENCVARRVAAQNLLG